MHVVDRSMFTSLDVTIEIRCNTKAAATDLADVSWGLGDWHINSKGEISYEETYISLQYGLACAGAQG